MARVIIDLSHIKAAIFDMDGTMVNNMPFHKRAWKTFLKRHGLSLTDDEFRKKISGRKNNQIFELVFHRSLSSEEISKFTREKEAIYRELYAPEIKEIEGLHIIIKALREKGIHLAVATTAPKENRNFVLRVLGLEKTFEVVLGDEHVSRGKPDPEIYLKTARKLKVAPGNCLVFEDTAPGVEAGKLAGMTVVGILSTHSKEELGRADYLIDDYSQISLA